MPASGRRVDEGGPAEGWVGARTGQMTQGSLGWWEAVCRRRKWPAAPSSWEGNEETKSTGVDDLEVSCVSLSWPGAIRKRRGEDLESLKASL